MKKPNESNIQANIFHFALTELIRSQRNSFEPIWTVDSWVKLLIWLCLNCGMSGEQESLENFLEALGSPLTVRMRKLFFERTIENMFLYVIADPADPRVLVMPMSDQALMTFENCKKALVSLGLFPRINPNFDTWETHDELIAIPWNSFESGC